MLLTEGGVFKTAFKILSLCCACALAPSAYAQELRFYYCYAVDAENGTVFISSTAAVGPISERRHYGARFVANLIDRNLLRSDTQGYCVMRARDEEIETAKKDLRLICNECGSANVFQSVEFAGQSPSSADSGNLAKGAGPAGSDPAEEQSSQLSNARARPNVLTGAADVTPGAQGRVIDAVPFQIAAPLPHLVNVKLVPEYDNAFVQVHYQFFLCGQEIFVSYSLRPVPARGVNEIRLNAVVTGNNMKPHHLIETARTVPGHQLGCQSQKHRIADLASFESQLGQGKFSDGTTMWSRRETIEHLLGRLSLFASGSPWPAGSR